MSLAGPLVTLPVAVTFDDLSPNICHSYDKLLFCMYNTVAVAAPVDPSSVPATKSANTSKSDVPTSVASVSKVPLVVPNAFTLVAPINAS